MERLKFVLQLIDRVSRPAKAASRGLDELRRAFRQAGKSADETGNRFQGVANKVKSLMDASQTAFQIAGNMSLAAEATGRLGRAMIGAVVPAIAESVNLEQAMARVKSLTNDTTATFEEQRAIVLEMGRTTKFTAMEAADGMSFLAMAGFRAKDQIAALPAVLNLAVAGTTDLGRTAEISSNIMGAFGLRADEMREAADILTATFTNSNTTLETLGETMKYVGPAAKSAGVGLKSVAKFTAVLGNAGIDGSMAGTALRTTLLALQAPTKLASKALKRLKIDTEDSMGNLRDPLDLLVEINAATAKLGGNEKAGLLKDLFGKYAFSSIMEILDKLDSQPAGVAGYQEIAKKIDDYAGAAKRVAGIQQDTAIGSWTELKSAVSGLAIELGDLLSGELRSAIDMMKAVVGAVRDWAHEHPGLTKAILIGTLAVGGMFLALSGLLTVLASATAGVGVALMGFAGFKVLQLLVIPLLWKATLAVGAFLLSIFSLPVLIAVGLAAVGVAMYVWWDDIKAFWNGAVEWMQDIGDAIGEALLGGFSGGMDRMNATAKEASKLAGGPAKKTLASVTTPPAAIAGMSSQPANENAGMSVYEPGPMLKSLANGTLSSNGGKGKGDVNTGNITINVSGSTNATPQETGSSVVEALESYFSDQRAMAGT